MGYDKISSMIIQDGKAKSLSSMADYQVTEYDVASFDSLKNNIYISFVTSIRSIIGPIL